MPAAIPRAVRIPIFPAQIERQAKSKDASTNRLLKNIRRDVIMNFVSIKSCVKGLVFISDVICYVILFCDKCNWIGDRFIVLIN